MFAGLQHRIGAQDGELWDMRNLCSDNFPVMSTRPRRYLQRTVTKPNGLYAWQELCWVDGTGFYYNGELKGTVTDSRKRFCGIGAYIVILPDKKYYNYISDEFGSMEAAWSGSNLTFTNGTLFGEPAKCNCIEAGGADWSRYFKAGDAVTISGCTRIEYNNKTPIIREIDGDRMYFYEYVFKLDGPEEDTPYVESGALSISRSVPDMDWIVENENRLWGCKGSEIYASKLGDIFNWNVFDGLTTDSYAVTVGSTGEFVGAISYADYPVFFKTDHIYKEYGNYPSNFQLMGTATMGMEPGSGDGAAIAGETLFYLSRGGFCAYTGGVPQNIATGFGTERYKNCVAGTDGLKYYASVEDEDGGHRLFVYDTQTGLWHAEDEAAAIAFAQCKGELYMLLESGELWQMGRITNAAGTKESAFDWWAEFADFTAGDANEKDLQAVQIRAELDKGAKMELWIRYDSAGKWERLGELHNAETKQSVYLSGRPRRADHYRLRVSGHGGCRIWSIAREYYVGSEFR